MPLNNINRKRSSAAAIISAQRKRSSLVGRPAWQGPPGEEDVPAGDPGALDFSAAVNLVLGIGSGAI